MSRRENPKLLVGHLALAHPRRKTDFESISDNALKLDLWYINLKSTLEMARKDKTDDGHSSRFPKQRRDSGYAPLGQDEKVEHMNALSLVITCTPERVPEYVGRIIVPRLLSWRDVQTRREDAFAVSSDNSMQDRLFSTVIPMTASDPVMARVSRFEDIFQQMRKKFQLRHRPAPIQISFSVFGHRVRNKDALNSANEDIRSSEPVSASSEVTTWSSLFRNPSSSRTNSNASLEATSDATNSHQGPKCMQEILQMPSWRSPTRNPEENGPRSDLSINRVISHEQTDYVRSQAIAATVKARQIAIEKQFGPGTLQSFHPSHRALRRQGVLREYDISRASTISTGSSSPTYLGDPFVERNRSANIPDEENCALWVLGLPGHVTYTGLLHSIRGIGKIYAVVINPPTSLIRTSAAKIVFFQRLQAERLFHMIEAHRFIVMGQVIQRVAWNKIKSGPYPHQSHSRAIRITGPQELMDFDFFDDFFSHKFAYDLDRRGVVHCNRRGQVSHEWHFGSLRCQSASAKTAIERELKGIFEVEWAVDPCEFR